MIPTETLLRKSIKFVLGAALCAFILLPNSVYAQSKDSLRGISPKLVAVANSPSGLKWIGGDRESPFMHPGMDCIACHAQGEGPRLKVAGTVYSKLDEPDDYLGVEAVTVQLTDKTGKSVSLVSNKAGNFFSGRGFSLTAPYTVKLIRGKAESGMGMPAPSGDCASCHTAKGASGAPGRILAP